MYSRDFFVGQFQKLESEDLIEKLATQELTDEARNAVLLVLDEREVPEIDLNRLVHQSTKDQYLKTSATNQCDFCGKSLFPGPFSYGDQKFCNIDCFHTSQLRRVAVDITDAQALKHAKSLKTGPCPKCALQGRNPDIFKSHFVTSLVFVVTTSTECKLLCKSCANLDNLWAILYCVTVGWWSPKGIFITPFQVMANLSEISHRCDSGEPSDSLIDWARLMLAENQLKSAGGGRWALRA